MNPILISIYRLFVPKYRKASIHFLKCNFWKTYCLVYNIKRKLKDLIWNITQYFESKKLNGRVAEYNW